MFLRQNKSDCWVYLYSHTNDLAGKTNAPHTHSPDVYIMQASCSPENCHQIQFFETLCLMFKSLSSDGVATWACTMQWTWEHDWPKGEVWKKCEYRENFLKNLLSGYRHDLSPESLCSCASILYVVCDWKYISFNTLISGQCNLLFIHQSIDQLETHYQL